ncbi:hypothetical protein WCLP8_3560015 [uncultured Gammaproteobacteria bacterium]
MGTGAMGTGWSQVEGMVGPKRAAGQGKA